MIAVGIDVSKYKSTVTIISSDGEILMKPKEYSHTKNDLSELSLLLKSYPDQVKIAMESTGHYHYPILKQMLEDDFFVFVVNLYLMKKYSDNDIRKSKTDKKDSIRIAYYVLEKSYLLQQYTNIDQKYNDLKFLSRQYSQCIGVKALQHALMIPVHQLH
jgi:transposase